jgi:hypothetical protein
MLSLIRKNIDKKKKDIENLVGVLGIAYACAILARYVFLKKYKKISSVDDIPNDWFRYNASLFAKFQGMENGVVKMKIKDADIRVVPAFMYIHDSDYGKACALLEKANKIRLIKLNIDNSVDALIYNPRHCINTYLIEQGYAHYVPRENLQLLYAPYKETLNMKEAEDWAKIMGYGKWRQYRSHTYGNLRGISKYKWIFKLQIARKYMRLFK